MRSTGIVGSGERRLQLMDWRMESGARERLGPHLYCFYHLLILTGNNYILNIYIKQNIDCEELYTQISKKTFDKK